MEYKIIIDPGHGGFDAGAAYQERTEKDDNLRLALAVGKKLSQEGYDVVYTRTTDQYDSPYEKAQIANNEGGDVFISFHRNFAERTNLYHGIQSLVYDDNETALRLANDINAQLEKIGFQNLGIEKRKELVVLRRTNMPAVLLEVGFINSTKDNELFDEKFNEIVNAIADGIMEALPMKTHVMENVILPTSSEPMQEPMPEPMSKPMQEPMPEPMQEPMPEPMSKPTPASMPTPMPKPMPAPGLVPNEMPMNEMDYYVQVGLFRYPENAVYLMEQLRQQGYETVWKRVGGLIGIWVGPLDSLDEAVIMQRKLQEAGYDTLIVTEMAQRK